jgi:hypothetical protein
MNGFVNTFTKANIPDVIALSKYGVETCKYLNGIKNEINNGTLTVLEANVMLAKLKEYSYLPRPDIVYIVSELIINHGRDKVLTANRVYGVLSESDIKTITLVGKYEFARNVNATYPDKTKAILDLAKNGAMDVFDEIIKIDYSHLTNALGYVTDLNTAILITSISTAMYLVSDINEYTFVDETVIDTLSVYIPSFAYTQYYNALIDLLDIDNISELSNIVNVLNKLQYVNIKDLLTLIEVLKLFSDTNIKELSDLLLSLDIGKYITECGLQGILLLYILERTCIILAKAGRYHALLILINDFSNVFNTEFSVAFKKTLVCELLISAKFDSWDNISIVNEFVNILYTIYPMWDKTTINGKLMFDLDTFSLCNIHTLNALTKIDIVYIPAQLLVSLNNFGVIGDDRLKLEITPKQDVYVYIAEMGIV